MWKIIKFILFLLAIGSSMNILKGQEGAIGQIVVLILVISVCYYFFYVFLRDELPAKNDINKEYKHTKNTNVDSKIMDKYTNDYDNQINLIFPANREDAYMKIAFTFNLSSNQACIIFDRWAHFGLIDYHPTEEWIPAIPNQTLTVEQFKNEMQIERLDVKIDTVKDELYFEYKDRRGVVINKNTPKNPMISNVIYSNHSSIWILHEEGQLQALPQLMPF